MGTNAVSRIGVAVCIVAGVVGPARGESVALAVTGDAVPDGNGSYSTFAAPVLNNLGQIAFQAELLGTSHGIYDDEAVMRAEAGSATVIAHEGAYLSDYIYQLVSFSRPAMNNAGQVAFKGEVRGFGPGAGQAIFRSTGGTVPTPLVQGADPSPDGNGSFLQFGNPVINDVGNVAFWSLLTGTAGGEDDNEAVILHRSSLPELAAREGQSPPDGNGEYSIFNSKIAITEFGNLAFTAYLRNTTWGTQDDSAICGYSKGLLCMAVREGTLTPDVTGEFAMLSTVPTAYQWMSTSSVTSAFRAQLRHTVGGGADNSGIFWCRGLFSPSISTIAREGETPPDGNGEYDGFDVNLAHKAIAGVDMYAVAFRAYMRNTAGGALDDVGIYRDTISLVPEKIVRTGDASPDSNGTFRYLGDPIMNAGGQIAFAAGLIGTSGGASDSDGIFLGNGQIVLKVVRTGDELLGSTIVELAMAGGAYYHNGLNDFAQVAYRAVLADGREVLALATPLVQYSGGATGGWPDLANWTLGIAPAAVHDVAITPLGDVEVIGPRIDATVKSLTLGATGGGMATLSLTGGGDLTAVGSFTVTLGGSVEVGAGRTLSAAALINQGTLTFGTGEAHVAGDVSNGPGGRILVPAGANAWMHGRVENQGAINVAAGGALHLPDFTGDGCTGAGTAWLEGHVRPGPGTWAMAFAGDAVFGPNCVTHIELRGPTPKLEYDQVSVAGVAVLEGELSVELINRYVPMPGDSFEVITYGSRVSEFASVTGLDDLGGHAGLDFELTYAAAGVTLTATAMGGDANLDTKVNVFDLAILGNNYGGSGKDWMRADFTGDGDVNVFDLAVLGNNYGRSAGGSAGLTTGGSAGLTTGGSAGLTTGGQAIPEPATILIVTAAGLPMLLKRRRNA